MIRILLIRHGHTDLLGRVLYGRLPGIHLSEDGFRQAQDLASALRRLYAIDAVVSSPLERALETAQPIADAFEKAIVLDDGIVELDFGSWIGKPFEELRHNRHWTDFNRRRSMVRAPGGESMMEVQARAWHSIDALRNRYEKDSTVAVITHGDVIRCLLLLVLGMPIDHIHRLEVAPASVTELAVGEDGVTVKRMNQVF